MSLEHAILGFLNYHPYSGYDLKKIFDTSVQHFWPADQSQIYRTLNRLTEQGYAQVEKVDQENRPDRKVYHITADGRAELLQVAGGSAADGWSHAAHRSSRSSFAGHDRATMRLLAKFEGLCHRSCAPSWPSMNRCPVSIEAVQA